MSRQFWDRLNIIAGFFAFAVVFGFAMVSSHLEIKDLDLWLHLRTGQLISQAHTVFSNDIFSNSLNGKVWVNHEWLFQVFIAFLHGLGGFDALIMMQVVVVTLTLMVILLAFYRRDRQLLLAFCLLMIVLIYQQRLTIRPDIFSILFVAIFLSVLTQGFRHRWSLVVLSLIQVLWVNMHGFFFIGPVLVWLSWLGLEVNGLVKKEKVEAGFLPLASVLLPLCCLCNPLGIQGVLYPLKVMAHLGKDAGIFFDHIVELARPITRNTLFSQKYVFFKLMIFLSAYSFVVNRKNLDARVILIWVFFLVFSLAAIRNMVFMAIAGTWVLLLNSQHVSAEGIFPVRFTDIRFKFITSILMKVVLVVWTLNVTMDLFSNGYFDFDTYQRKTEFDGISKRNFPYKAVDFLVAQKVKGNFFNDFNSGAYLIGRTYPNIKVFIDGRTEVYGGDFFRQYLRVWHKGDSKAFERFAARFHLTGAFLNSYNQDIPAKCVRMFGDLKGWVPVYFNEDALIFLKDVPENAALIKKFRVDFTRRKPPQLDLFKVQTKKVAPFPYVNRGKTLLALGYKEQAIQEAKSALAVASDYADAWALLGKIYVSQKLYQKGFEHLRMACMLYPPDDKSRKLLAFAQEKLGAYHGAQEQYERLLEKGSRDSAVVEGYTRCLIVRGDRLLRRRQYLQARRIYEQALTMKKYADTVYYRIGLTFLKSGDKIGAQKNFNQGLKVNPHHQGILKHLHQISP